MRPQFEKGYAMRKALLILLALTVIGFLIWWGYQVTVAQLEYKKFVQQRAEHQKRLNDLRNAPLF